MTSLPTTIEENVLRNISQFTAEQMHTLEVSCLETAQVSTHLIHTFSEGVYMRELHIPKGTFLIGKVHKQGGLNIVLKGSLIVYTADGVRKDVQAPCTIYAPVGRKVAVCTEDAVWLNIIPTTSTDVEEIEAEHFEDAESLDQALASADEAYQDVAALEREDFSSVCSSLGYTTEEVSAMSSQTADCIPFPYGSYSVFVKDSPIHGRGLFASAPIKAGDIISKARVGNMRTPAGRYTNHSCVPNAEMVMYENGDVDLVAIEDIGGAEGGMITSEVLVDYASAWHNTRVSE